MQFNYFSHIRSGVRLFFFHLQFMWVYLALEPKALLWRARSNKTKHMAMMMNVTIVWVCKFVARKKTTHDSFITHPANAKWTNTFLRFTYYVITLMLFICLIQDNNLWYSTPYNPISFGFFYIYFVLCAFYCYIYVRKHMHYSDVNGVIDAIIS